MEIEKTNAGDDLDLVKLMDQIRKDADKRKRDALRNGASFFYRQLTTLGVQGLPVVATTTSLNLQPEFEQRDRYHLNELLGFHDEAFVKNAYTAILRRDPDDAGLVEYLRNLRSGRYSKIDIIRSLRFSSEGQAANVPIEGLGPLGGLRKLYRVPILGYLLQLAVAIVRLPVLIAHHRQLEAHTAAQLERVSSHFNEAVSNLANTARKQQEVSNKQIAALHELKSTLSLHMEGIMGEQQRLGEAQRRLRTETVDYHLPDSLYNSLEEALRGTPAEIKEDARAYLPILINAGVTSDILDLGSGRGEWLEVLKEAGLQAVGIDDNHLLIQRCRLLSLDVVEAEALEYLRSVEKDSFNAITAFHILEHLTLKNLVSLLEEIRRVLKPGGLLIVETPNPENLLVGSCNFYLDPTHKKPIPIQTMKVLLEVSGFEIQDVMKLHPVKGVQIEVKDQLTSHLNHFLYGPMNYAVVARTPNAV